MTEDEYRDELSEALGICGCASTEALELVGLAFSGPDSIDDSIQALRAVMDKHDEITHGISIRCRLIMPDEDERVRLVGQIMATWEDSLRFPVG